MGRWFASLGPGLLFAATAVGVSHLVQSTRAGAQAGLGLVGLVVLAHALKYPAFRFGPYFASVTGTSLLQAYREQGRWALVLYAVVTLGTMFTVQAAVTLVTVSLFLGVVGVRANPIFISLILLLVGAAFLAVGRYRWLDRINKGLVVVLSVSTVAATVLAAPGVDPTTFGVGISALVDPPRIAFAVALLGWMPTAPDVSVWQSMWVLEKSRMSGEAPDVEQSSRDFHVGYIGTCFLALCFVVLGAGLLHQTKADLPQSVAGFSRGLIDLYAETLGSWSRPIIGASALAAMASTMLTVLDGFPRALAGLALRFRGDETDLEETTGASLRAYWLALGLLVTGSLVVMAAFLTSLRAFIDVATTLSFLTAPVLCFLNHRAVTSSAVPIERRPSAWLLRFSLVSIALQAAFACWFLANR